MTKHVGPHCMHETHIGTVCTCACAICTCTVRMRMRAHAQRAQQASAHALARAQHAHAISHEQRSHAHLVAGSEHGEGPDHVVLTPLALHSPCIHIGANSAPTRTTAQVWPGRGAAAHTWRGLPGTRCTAASRLLIMPKRRWSSDEVVVK